MILNAPFNSRSMDLFNTLNWIPIYRELHINQLCTHLQEKGNTPNYLNELLVINFNMHTRNTRYCNYSCAVRCMSYKMGSVSTFWSHICACKFMLAYIYHVLFRVRGRVGDYLNYSSGAATILLLCWENVWKDLKTAI